MLDFWLEIWDLLLNEYRNIFFSGVVFTIFLKEVNVKCFRKVSVCMRMCFVFYGEYFQFQKARQTLHDTKGITFVFLFVDINVDIYVDIMYGRR